MCFSGKSQNVNANKNNLFYCVYNTMTMKSKLIEANPKHSVDKITSNLT